MVPVFDAPKPLKLQLRKQATPSCPTECLCEGEGLCFRKNITYEAHWKDTPPTENYIGETGRSYHSRKKEHATTSQSSQVYRHLRNNYRHIDPSTDRLDLRIAQGGFANAEHRRVNERRFIAERNPRLNIRR